MHAEAMKQMGIDSKDDSYISAERIMSEIGILFVEGGIFHAS